MCSLRRSETEEKRIRIIIDKDEVQYLITMEDKKQLVKADARELRKAEISKLLIKGYKLREISDSLAERGIVNGNGNPFALCTLSEDIKELCAEWKAQSFAMIDQYKSKVWAELQALKRVGWENDDHAIVLHAIKQERELMGLDEVRNVNFNFDELPQIIYVRSEQYNLLSAEKEKKKIDVK